MTSFLLIKEFFNTSYEDFKLHKKLFIKAFIVLVTVNVFEAFPWELAGGEQNSTAEIIFNLIVGLIGLIINVDVINSQVAIIKQKEKERLLYTVFGFFIAQVFYMLIVLFGLLLLIIPGLAAFVLFGLAPLITIIEPNASSFKRSFHLVKKKFITVAILVFGMLLLEFFPAMIASIPGWQIRSAVLIVLSYPLALISFLFIQATVKVYFHLLNAE